MKQPTFNGKELLPLSVMEAAHAGDAMAMERVLRYYEGYMGLSVYCRTSSQNFKKHPCSLK